MYRSVSESNLMSSATASTDPVEIASAVGELVDTVGRDDPDYTGMSVDLQQLEYFVVRVDGDRGLSPILAQRYRSAVPLGYALRYSSGVVTRVQIDALDSLVRAAEEELADLGVSISVAGMIRGIKAPYQIRYGGRKKLPAAARKILTPFGADTVDIAYGVNRGLHLPAS